MSKIQWGSYKVWPGIFAIILALIGVAVAPVRVVLLSIALVLGFGIWLMSLRHRQMDPEHAKRMQTIARSLDAAILANNAILSFNDGQGDVAINETCFRADFSDLDPLLREWVEIPHVLELKKGAAKKAIESSANEQWPTLHPHTLGVYAFDYAKNNLTNPIPPTPAIALSPPVKPSQLLQGTASGGGTVLFTYPTGLTGPALAEAQKEEASLRQWVTGMLKSPEVESWRAARERQAELRMKLSHRLQEISVQTSLPRGKCTVCT